MEKQRDFFQKLQALGNKEANYCISLVVSGPSEYRIHPTYIEAVNFISQYFTIIQAFPISVKNLPLSRVMQMIFKIEKLISLTFLRRILYKKHLASIDLESAHQVMFILCAV